MNKNYPNAWKYDKTVTMTGNMYRIYPDYFNYNKTKIIIHHTATDYDPNWTKQDVMKEIQKMYKYHTIDRDFWDIGYNFIIDQMWNIYEWRHGWEGAVWMHTANNNASSIWISLMWNFENTVPTDAQLASLINLTTSIARFYNIDPNKTTYTFQTNNTKEPYVTAKENPTIMGHKDVAVTACPGANLYTFLPELREEVSYRLKNKIYLDTTLPASWTKKLAKLRWTTSSQSINSQSTTSVKTTSTQTKSDFSKRLAKLQKDSPEILYKAADILKDRYSWKLSKTVDSSQKIKWKITLDKAKNYLNQAIYVLLYELSQDFNEYDITCTSECTITYQKLWEASVNTMYTDKAKIIVWNDLELQVKWKIIHAIGLTISSKNDIVTVSNYERKSYTWIPWNSFHWTLVFRKDYIKDKNWNQEYKYVVINWLSFDDYMKWIVETNDTESQAKNEVMALVSKSYALFYMDPQNIHPSIPTNASYNAVDDPDIFQKYVWAGLEKTLTKRYKALETTKNKIVIYDNYIPILPYFSCSAWFTLSAEEKRWWNDTPYLRSIYDFWACKDFNGHWVWLAGQWAEYLAKQWLSYQDILKYYYDWIEIRDL